MKITRKKIRQLIIESIDNISKDNQQKYPTLTKPNSYTSIFRFRPPYAGEFNPFSDLNPPEAQKRYKEMLSYLSERKLQKSIDMLEKYFKDYILRLVNFQQHREDEQVDVMLTLTSIAKKHNAEARRLNDAMLDMWRKDQKTDAYTHMMEAYYYFTNRWLWDKVQERRKLDAEYAEKVKKRNAEYAEIKTKLEVEKEKLRKVWPDLKWPGDASKK